MKRVKFKGDEERQALISQYVDRDGYVFAGEENHVDENTILLKPPTKYHVKTDDGWGIESEIWLDNEVRYYRNYLLAQSDFSQLDDVRALHQTTEQNDWRTYRKTLRDLPENLTPTGVSYKQIEWPERPDGKDTLAILAVAEKERGLMGI